MIKVTLISHENCTHCVAVKNTLKKLKKDFPDIVVEDIKVDSPRGMRLVSKYSILSSPGILVNDEFFAMGGAKEEQFRKKFEEIKKKSRSK